MFKYDIRDIINKDRVLINENIIINPSYYNETEIISISEVGIDGYIEYNGIDSIMIIFNIKGQMILPCSVSLKPVTHDFNIEYDDIIYLDNDKNEEYLKIIDNTLDIMPIIWQNIVVEIPMRITHSDLTKVIDEGNGWKLLSEDKKKNEIDPRLEKLKDLLDD